MWVRPGEALETMNGLGRLEAFLTPTATRAMGEMENFMTLVLWAVSEVVGVPFSRKNRSVSTRPTMLPAGQSSIGQTQQPILRTVRWTNLTIKSPLGTYLGP